MRTMLCAGFRGLLSMVANLVMLMLLLMMTPSYAVNLNLNLTLNMVLAPDQTQVLAPDQTQLKFGSSVAFWRTDGEMKLAVGAPLTPYEHMDNLPLGNVFLCTLKGHCQPYHHLPNLTPRDKDALKYGKHYFEKMGMGLGETLAYTSSNKTTDSILLVCAPRFPMWGHSGGFEGRGACFRLTDSSSQPERIIPFQEDKWGYHRTGSGMAGFSAALAKDESVFMGCPSTYYWQGSLSSRNYTGPKPYKFSKEESDNEISDDSYEGWALALGRFSSETNMEYIATSAPQANNTNEQIKFFSKNFVRLETRYSGEEASTHGFKSYYGYALAVGDVDKDGNDDLIVGAPLAKGKNGVAEGGKVFVYYGPLNNRLARKTQILEGPTAWSRFGSAVVSDDFNHDGYYDVAVGAPYGKQGWGGAVYIYMGGQGGLCETTGGICHTPDLLICASDFSPPSPGSSGDAGLQFLYTASSKHCKAASSSPLLSLGYSLATADVDGNGYPDLLIGAPRADKALLIRSAPVVVLKGDIFFEPNIFFGPLVHKTGNINCTWIDKTGSEKVICFKLKFNIQYEAHQLNIQNIDVIYTINLDYEVENKRIYFRDNNEAEIKLRTLIHKTEPTTNYAPPVLDVYVKPDDVENVEQITASVTVQLADQLKQSDERQQMDPIPPVLYNPEQVFVAHRYVEECESKKKCGDCLQTPGCKWCSQLSTPAKWKCFADDAHYIGKCANTTSTFGENQFAITENHDLSVLTTFSNLAECNDVLETKSCADFKSKGLCPGIGHEACKKTCGFCPLPEADSGVDFSQRLVQLKPQRIKLKLQKDVPLNITVNYRQAQDYPIDLYYLMDISKSMEQHKNTVAGLMSKIADTLRQHTKQVRLGFGTFVDKALLPFANMSPQKLEQPCTECIPTFSFRNNLPLSGDTDYINSFKDKLKKLPMSGNLDAPEGGFDALMQVMKCTDEIGWSRNARRIIVFSTDAKFHSAGDGKLLGIIDRNDEQCHLNDQGEYTHYTKLDYPSVAQINEVAKEEQVNILFAVEEHERLYEMLTNEIESSSYGILINTSENIVQLVEDKYLALTSKVELKHNTEDMDGALDIEYFARCPGGPENTLNKTNTCHNIQKGDEIEFKLQVTLQKDLNEQNFEVKVGTTEDKLVIEVETFCDCNCQEDSHSVIDLF